MPCWLADSLRRFYPRSPAEQRDELRLGIVKGERISFQVVCRSADQPTTVSARVDGPAGIRVRIRHAGLVPVPHLSTETPLEEIEGADYLPGFVPDPLLPETTILVGPWETTCFWVSIEADDAVVPGEHRLRVTLGTGDGDLPPLTIILNVHPATLPIRANF